MDKKFLIYSLPGFGGDSIASMIDIAFTDMLPTLNKALSLTDLNRSDGSINMTGLLFKSKRIDSYIVAETLNSIFMDNTIDPEILTDYLNTTFYSKYPDKSYKIAVTFLSDLNYSKYFSDHFKISTTVNKDYILKHMIVHMHKCAFFKQSAFNYINSNSKEAGIIDFYDYSDTNNRNALQAKLKNIYATNFEGNIQIPQYIMRLAEYDRAQDDYAFYIDFYLNYFVNRTNENTFDVELDSEKFLFTQNEFLKIFESFDIPAEKMQILTEYNNRKVTGNLNILNTYGYDATLEALSYEEKAQWLLETFTPHFQRINVECNFV